MSLIMQHLALAENQLRSILMVHNVSPWKIAITIGSIEYIQKTCLEKFKYNINIYKYHIMLVSTCYIYISRIIFHVPMIYQ
jgi:hypothetical protein